MNDIKEVIAGLEFAQIGWVVPDIRAAIQREHNIKHWPRAWKVRKIVARNPDWDDLFETIAK